MDNIENISGKVQSGQGQTRYYQDDPKIYVAVDCIIFGFDAGSLNILLFKRKVEPMAGEWSLIGGFLQENESLDQAAERILFKHTGLSNLYLEQLYTYGDMFRDPGARVVSTAYFALIKVEDYNEELGHKYGAKWFDIRNAPDLIFDHNIMVDKALRRLRRKSLSQPIGFELLPDKFTIPQLQKLYEAIHQTDLDKRNFRKKILSMNLLEKLEEKERAGSRKGAFLYRFDAEKYLKAVDSGFLFEI
jgi:8-oxo-dGTP diphosphatase